MVAEGCVIIMEIVYKMDFFSTGLHPLLNSSGLWYVLNFFHCFLFVAVFVCVICVLYKKLITCQCKRVFASPGQPSGHCLSRRQKESNYMVTNYH